MGISKQMYVSFRPITFLSTTYKFLTSFLRDRTYYCLEQNDIFPLEQKGYRRGSYAAKTNFWSIKSYLRAERKGCKI